MGACAAHQTKTDQLAQPCDGATGSYSEEVTGRSERSLKTAGFSDKRGNNTIAEGLAHLPVEDDDENFKNRECDIAFMYDDVLLGIKTDEELEQEMITKQEWEQEMTKNTEMQMIKKNT
ncbi:hypothetical protein NDU88_006617 [Pleurodeles waltl]|uniref:Uncharacterized protein n=1 Tax=Pleurodeles waltl TaxID=8319 RepID=A0AAV7SQE0_PLEWA|nr:hypothetical protein NDU88_006617 [Pleurodeles waltl]